MVVGGWGWYVIQVSLTKTILCHDVQFNSFFVFFIPEIYSENAKTTTGERTQLIVSTTAMKSQVHVTLVETTRSGREVTLQARYRDD